MPMRNDYELLRALCAQDAELLLNYEIEKLVSSYDAEEETTTVVIEEKPVSQRSYRTAYSDAGIESNAVCLF